MKKITDERLVLRNLQHIRIAFIVQTLGILSILGYELYQGGLEGMRENPIWLVFILTSVVYAYLSMNVSVEHEKEIKNPKRSFKISLCVITLIASSVAYLISITPDFGWGDGLLIAAILLICGCIPIYYIYRLRMKHIKEFED